MDGSRRVERYELLERIGKGGMAVVHLARQIDLDRLVALKELSELHADDPSWASRFLRESRLAGSLTHANIVTVYDYFEDEGTPYIAMEYLERGSLRPLVGTLDPPQIGGVLADVLAGLRHSMKRGIVHRDLKPENLLVTAEGGVKIADFGIAKATSRLSLASFNTQAGVAVGTPGYMAPEQAMARDIGPWTDLYALGCVAYELCAGVLPFADTAEPFALMMRHISEPIPAARSVNPELDPELSDWIDSLLVKDPAERVGSADEAWDALEDVLDRSLGLRWRRASALPVATVAGAVPARRFTSLRIEPVEYTGEPAEPEIPDALPGPYTPPPADAVVSAELVALDPSPPAETAEPVAPPPQEHSTSGFITVDVDALTAPPRPPGPDTALIPPPDAPRRTVQAPAPVDEPPAPSRPARRRPALLVAAGAAAVAAIAAVALLTPSDDDPLSRAARSSPPTPTPAPPTSGLTAGPLAVRVPAGWSASTGAKAPDGLRLDGVIRATPPEGGDVVVGMAPSASTTFALLPAGLVDDDAVPERSEVDLGGARGYLYPALPGGMTAYVVPTDEGVATIACEDPVTSACQSVADTLTIDGATVLALGPDPRFGKAIDAVLQTIDRAGAKATEALRSAETPRGQSRVAGRAGTSLARATAALRDLEPGPAEAAATRVLYGAAGGMAGGYERLAGAARRSDRGAYDRAAAAVRRAQSQMAPALADLKSAGYTDLARPSSRAIPALERRPAPPARPSATTQPGPTAQSTPAPTQVQPQATRAPTVRAKPTPVPAKPTPVPIEDG